METIYAYCAVVLGICFSIWVETKKETLAVYWLLFKSYINTKVCAIALSAGVFAQVAKGHKEPTRKVKTHSIVQEGNYWIRIEDDPPLVGKKIFLIRKDAGVASQGVYNPKEQFFDHWFPLPEWKEDKSTSAGDQR